MCECSRVYVIVRGLPWFQIYLYMQPDILGYLGDIYKLLYHQPKPKITNICMAGLVFWDICMFNIIPNYHQAGLAPFFKEQLSHVSCLGISQSCLGICVVGLFGSPGAYASGSATVATGVWSIHPLFSTLPA